MHILHRVIVVILCLGGCGGSEPSAADAAPDALFDTAVQGPDQDASEAGTDATRPYCTPMLPDGGWRADGCSPPAPAERDLLDDALGELGLDRCQAGFLGTVQRIFPPDVVLDRYRLPFFDPMHHRAAGAPRLAHDIVQQLDDAIAAPRPVTAALALAAHYAGCGVEVCIDPVAPNSDHPLADAVGRLISSAGGQPDTADLRQRAAAVPRDLQQALAPMLDAMAAAARARDEALANADRGDPPIPLDALFEHAASLTIPVKTGKILPATEQYVQNMLAGAEQGFAYCKLYRGALQLAAAVEGAELSRFAGLDVSFTADTPLGRILLRGAEHDTYEPQDSAVGAAIALLLDTGGDDVYRIQAGATASVQNPVSVHVDLGGRDRYGYVEVPSPRDGGRLPADEDGRLDPLPAQKIGPISLSGISRQGAGRLGVGLLFDLGDAQDSYTSLRMSQGFGALGVGVLYDAGGDDEYAGEDGVQGAGVFGVGILIDGGGDDTFRTYRQSQGFGFVKGVGLLYDAAGRDAYLADVGDPDLGGDPLYPSAQQADKSNTSMSQGAGCGRRGDFGDGVYMSGGLGVLRDRQGDDRYEASVFGQGTGFWFGSGILADGDGDDAYDGLWYVQGSSAHFALSVLWDQTGNDRYNQTLVPTATSIGVGHDFAVGWLLDLGGDDAFRAPKLSLGSGNNNGIGVLVNAGGRDRYETTGNRTLGGASLSASDAGTWRAQVLTVGIFIDTAGVDEYVIDDQPALRDGTIWRYQSSNEGVPTRELGVGIDGTGRASAF